MKSREIRLRRIPNGLPVEADFETIESELPAPTGGGLLVRNIWLSVDPYMRGRMTGVDSYVSAFRVGETLDGPAIGRVIAGNRHPTLRVGDLVRSNFGWRDAFLSDGSGLEKLDPGLGEVQNFLGPLGAPGLTAYVGLLNFGRPQPGDVVFVSGAAGAVGSLVCQIARIKGCRVVASTGSPVKADWLRNVAKVDAVIDYRATPDLDAALAAACPEGIDIYFDNVGGRHLEAALTLMRVHGRIVACGAISIYNETGPLPGPTNLFQIVTQRLTMQGFMVIDHWDEMPLSAAAIGGWMKAGEIAFPETVVDGLERTVDAFVGLFRGDNLGKVLVRLADS